MSEGPSSDPTGKDNLVKVVKDTIDGMEDILKKAGDFVKVSVDDFVSHHVGCLAGLIGLYFKAFTRLGVKTRNETDRLCEKYFRDFAVQDAVEHLDDVEREWNSFLHDVDVKLNTGHTINVLKVGNQAPCELPLINARTGETTNLKAYLDSESLVLILLRHFA